MSGPEDTFRQAQIAFHGRMVAGATHEFQNHLAVIKEYSGLVGDLLQAKKADIGRIIDITRSIGERANRAAEMADVLNRFAHRGDVATCTFPVNEAVEELALLLQRFASEGRIDLETSLGKDAPVIENNPSLLQYLLFSLMIPLLDVLGENGRIIISTSAGKDNIALISILAEGPNSTIEQHDAVSPELLERCLDELSVTLSIKSENNRQEMVLTVPPFTGK